MRRQRVSACVGDACDLAGFGAPPAVVFSCFGLQQMPEPQEVPHTHPSSTHLCSPVSIQCAKSFGSRT